MEIGESRSRQSKFDMITKEIERDDRQCEHMKADTTITMESAVQINGIESKGGASSSHRHQTSPLSPTKTKCSLIAT